MEQIPILAPAAVLVLWSLVKAAVGNRDEISGFFKGRDQTG